MTKAQKAHWSQVYQPKIKYTRMSVPNGDFRTVPDCPEEVADIFGALAEQILEMDNFEFIFVTAHNSRYVVDVVFEGRDVASLVYQNGELEVSLVVGSYHKIKLADGPAFGAFWADFLVQLRLKTFPA